MDVVAESAARPRRTKRRGRHPEKALSAAFVRSAPPGRHADGNGLYLFVQPTGTRSWVQRLVIRGRRRELGLGAAGLVTLAEARELAIANRKLARSGGDPLSEKRRANGVPTFAEAAERVLDHRSRPSIPTSPSASRSRSIIRSVVNILPLPSIDGVGSFQ